MKMRHRQQSNSAWSRTGRIGLGCGAALLLTVAAPQAVFGDVIEPDEAACQSKNLGDACSGGGVSGSCQTSECCKLDYSSGTPPKSVCSACLRCKDGSATDTSSGVPVQPDATGDTTDDTGGVTDSDTSTGSGSTTGGGSSGACSVGGGALPASALGGMLLGAGALLWLRRRGAAR